MRELILWEQNKHIVLQIDTSVTKRQSKWILVCSNCQNERIGTYCQAWNVLKNNSSGICHKCLPRSEKSFNTRFKKNQISWNKDKRGKDNHSWKGGKTNATDTFRNTKEFKIWKKAILERDNYTCQMCNKTDIQLEVDHIKEYCNYPELGLNLDNGRTLCSLCHRLTPNYGPKAKKLKAS